MLELLFMLAGGLLVAVGLILYHIFVKPNIPTTEDIKIIITDTIADEFADLDLQEYLEEGRNDDD